MFFETARLEQSIAWAGYSVVSSEFVQSEFIPAAKRRNAHVCLA
jgi:hypothetical protein